MHPYRKARFTLQSACELGLVVKLRCDLCSRTHRYRSADLLTICGDISLDDISSLFRCEHCHRKDFMNVKWQSVSGPDVGTVRIRKLVGIRLVKVYDWEDGIC